MKTKKRYQTPKLSPQQIEAIQTHVTSLADVTLPEAYFLIDVEMVEENGRWYLRLYVDHRDPARKISLEDCKLISQSMEEPLEKTTKELENLPYNLEVSSPGLFRSLKSQREFQFYTGRRIEIKPKSGPTEIGFIDSFDPEAMEVLYRTTPDQDGEIKRIASNTKGLSISLAPELNKLDISVGLEDQRND